MNRILRVLLGSAIVLLASAGPVGADPAGPTDYLTTIDAVEPMTEAISVRMIGGDSFFEITQLQPVHILVSGYQGEPYLRIRANGVVEENRLAPTTYLNEERYGAGEIIPDFANAKADPEWVQVATGGRYAWHDHRSHWMNEAKPPGKGPGDTILEAVIPIVVDGTEVQVSVSSVLQSGPSLAPALLGAGLAAVLVTLMIAGRLPVVAIAPVSVVLLAGLAATFSVPVETGPPITLWVPPLVAIVCLVAAAIVRGRATSPLLEVGLVSIAGLQLLLWAVLGRDAVVKPILPTELPWSAHRFILGMAMVVGVGLIGAGLKQLQEAFADAVQTQRT